jgi:hypothetical protein
MAQRPVLALGAVAAALALVSAAVFAAAFAFAATTTSGIRVRVLGQGTPVARVPVRIRAFDGTTPENWPPEAKSLGEDSTGADGVVAFPDIAPGKYIVVAPCNRLPGDWIGGSSATVVDVLEGRATTTTLTLRRGGHIKGVAVGDPELIARAAVRTETPTALSSGCPMLAPTSVAADGSFEVAKAPMDARSIVRLEVPVGDGQLSVVKDFMMTKPETLSGTWELPPVDPAKLGTARVRLRDDQGKPTYVGKVEFTLYKAAPVWRYVVGYSVGSEDTVTVAKSLPPGRYFVRAWPEPGANPWWSATPESLTVEPGKTASLSLKTRPR